MDEYDSIKVMKKINETLRTRIHLCDYKDFHVGEFIHWPDHRGCFEYNTKWYTYQADERNFCTITGPFSEDSIVFACAMLLHVGNKFEDIQFTEEEWEIYHSSHFHSLNEIIE